MVGSRKLVVGGGEEGRLGCGEGNLGESSSRACTHSPWMQGSSC